MTVQWVGQWDGWTATRTVVETVAGLPNTELPWCATLILSIVVVVSGFVLALVRRLLPHESGDRLRWWIALLAHRRKMVAASRRQELTDRRDRR